MSTGQSTIERAERCLRDRVWPATSRGRHALDLAVNPLPGEPVTFAEAMAGGFDPAPPGTLWGPPWGTAWFRLRGEVPADWQQYPDADVELDVDLGWVWGATAGEALLYTPDGRAVESLGPGRPRLPLAPGPVDLVIEAAANPMPIWDWYPTDSQAGPAPDAPPRMRVSRADAVLVDRAAEATAQRLVLAISLVRETTDPARRARGLAALDAACDEVDDLGADPATRWQRVGAALAPVFTGPAAPDAPRLTAVANAHIDTAWLWPFRETVRKVARTYANVLALMAENPDLTFSGSQVQHLAWMHDEYPELFDRVREHVKAGRWLIVGGTWVEPDGNMPSGESFARQFLLGQTWLADHLGRTADTFWLPDTFGYSAGLPQIARLAGCDTFVTQKLSWNSVNVFPHTTLLWEGVDGSRLFTHFPPADNYCSMIQPGELHGAAAKMARQPVGEGLLLYGYGDGGGGPTRDMLVRIDELGDVAGLPRTEHGTVAGFFERARADLPQPPVWTGELYLEYHRGTLTSQPGIKQRHRRLEAALREAEVWATTAAVRHGAEYPAHQLRAAWQELLVCEFHDVLPGTSIGWVHDEATQRLDTALATATGVTADSLRILAGDGDGAIRATASPHGTPGVPPGGARPPAAQPVVRVALTRSDDGSEFVLDNGVLRATVKDGRLVSLLELASGRETVAPGGALGRLRLHPDRPTKWDAWDLDEAHARGSVAPPPGSATAASQPDGSAVVTVPTEYVQTTVTQRFVLAPEADNLMVDTAVDWDAADLLLRSEFDLDVAPPVVLAETMYGFVGRPTAANTSWEQAKFETCAQRWLLAGGADAGVGVALVTPTTYGSSVTRQVADDGAPFTRIASSLLRSPAFPDPRRDRGTHTFRHLVAPGADAATAMRLADAEAFPVRELRGTPFDPLVTVTGGGVLEALKLAEDGSGDVIVRLREPLGRRGRAEITWDLDVADVLETDLVERPTDATEGAFRADPDGAGGTVTLRPFQVVTLRLRRS